MIDWKKYNSKTGVTEDVPENHHYLLCWTGNSSSGTSQRPLPGEYIHATHYAVVNNPAPEPLTVTDLRNALITHPQLEEPKLGKLLAVVDQLEGLIEVARGKAMSDDEKEQQRRSFAYGNTKLANAKITREMIDEAVLDEGYTAMAKDEERFDVKAEAKPRIWRGESAVAIHWFWNEEDDRWVHLSRHGIHDEDIFVAGNEPKPTIDPTGMQLEDCSEVDWEEDKKDTPPSVDEDEVDKTKQPRIWFGVRETHVSHWYWCTGSAVWVFYNRQMSGIKQGDIFIGGRVPKPTMIPSVMKTLETCSVVDWEDGD